MRSLKFQWVGVTFINILHVSTVTYTIEVFTEETFVNNEYNLKVRIQGQGNKQTEDHALTEPTTEMQGYDKYRVLKYLLLADMLHIEWA